MARIEQFIHHNKPTLKNKPQFLARLSVLLFEGYTFHEGLTLLLPHHLKEFEAVLKEIELDLREGHGVPHILKSIGFSSSALLPIVIAEMDGHLAKALSGVATRLKKREDAQTKLKKLLIYPSVLFVFITTLLLAFRNFFLPNMQSLSISSKGMDGGLISNLPLAMSKIPDLIIGIIAVFLLGGLLCAVVYKKLTPTNKIRFASYVPIIRKLFFMWKTRAFASELGSLLQSGLSMQASLDVLVNQNLDSVLRNIALDIREHIRFGESFHDAAKMTNGLTKQFSSFVEHGAQSGHLPKELIIYSEHLDELIESKLSTYLSMLQPMLFALIAICILAAYVALLLPIYGMMDNV